MELFDGLDDLEEEQEEEDDEDKEEDATPQAPSIRTLVPKGGVGTGIEQLQRLERQYKLTGEDPEMSEEALAELHAALAKDAPKCPAISAVVWILRTLEELAIEEDEILEILAEIILPRADELGPQDLLHVVRSYGNCFWAADDEMLDIFAESIRRQLDDFTPVEVVRLANAMMRMGGTDDSRHVGMFFEMRQKVNLPQVDDFIKKALTEESTVNRKPSDETLLALKALDKMPNKLLKAKAEKAIQRDIEHDLPKHRMRSRSNELLRDGWDSANINQLQKLAGQKLAGGDDVTVGDKEEDEGRPEIRFVDLADSDAPAD